MKTMKTKLISILSMVLFTLGLSLCGVGFAKAQTPNPMMMMQSVSDQMLSSLKQNRSKLKQDPNLIYKLVNQILLPHVDVMGMSRSVLGRRAWESASPSQQKAFAKAFTNVVIDTYSSALNAYQDEQIKFRPLRESYEGKSRIMVQSFVIRPDGPSVPVNYRLTYKQKENTWKVYDLDVSGIGLLQSFRSQFNAQINQGKTIPDLTHMLQNRVKEDNGKKG